MSLSTLPFVYLFYGLAFFSMGLVVSIEGGRSSDARLRMALRPLAAFGFVHGLHEWVEMFRSIRAFPPAWLGVIDVIGLSFLVFSFLSLAAFGAYLALGSESTWRVSLLVPLSMEALWVFGLTQIQAAYPLNALPDVVDVWSRYALAVPASLLAAAGLVVQQRAFRRSGLIRFGQDSLWAAVAFLWYGLVGQTFFRIVQEALNNVIKHSRATNVNIKVEYRACKAFIHVRDNGLGFDLESAGNRGGRISLGLAGMKERAALLGGSLHVSSRPNYGTEIEAVIPCEAERKETNDTPLAGG